MKLKTFELLDNSAVTRMFVSKTVTLDSQIVIRDKRVKVTDLDEDSLGRVWVNKGLYVISAASLAYTVPAEAEAEWGKRSGQYEPEAFLAVDKADDALGLKPFAVPPDLGPAGNAVRAFGVYAKETAGQEYPPGSSLCGSCGFNAKDARGLAAHVRSKHP